MINSQLKFEGLTKNIFFKLLKFEGQSDQGHQFQNASKVIGFTRNHTDDEDDDEADDNDGTKNNMPKPETLFLVLC